MDLKKEFVGGDVVIYTNTYNFSVSKGSIKDSFFAIQPTDTLKHAVVMLTDWDYLIVNDDNTELFGWFGALLESKELFVRIVWKVIDARLVTGDFLQILQFRNVGLDEGSEVFIQSVQVMGKCLFEQVVKLALTQRLFDCDLLDFVVAVLTHLDCLPFDLNASSVYFLRSELPVKCFDGVWLGVLVGLGVCSVGVDSGNDVEAI